MTVLDFSDDKEAIELLGISKMIITSKKKRIVKKKIKLFYAAIALSIMQAAKLKPVKISKLVKKQRWSKFLRRYFKKNKSIPSIYFYVKE